MAINFGGNEVADKKQRKESGKEREKTLVDKGSGVDGNKRQRMMHLILCQSFLFLFCLRTRVKLFDCYPQALIPLTFLSHLSSTSSIMELFTFSQCFVVVSFAFLAWESLAFSLPTLTLLLFNYIFTCPL